MRDVVGDVRPGYERVADVFAKLLAEDGDYGAQVAAYVEGELVVDLASSSTDELRPVFSSTKGILGVVVALLVERGLLDLDAPVASLWPEFAAGGKQTITIRQLLSHQAGLVTVDGGYDTALVMDHDALAARLAAQVPLWRPGATHGYHALTLGTLGEELARRVTGRSVADLYTQEIGRPRGLALHLGSPVPQGVQGVDLPTAADLAAWATNAPTGPQPDSLLPLLEPVGGPPLFALVPDPAFQATGQSASAAVGSASGLAGLYAGLRHSLNGAPRLLSEATLAQCTQLQVRGEDHVIGRESRYGIVFELPSPALRFGTPRAFGHGGMGGSVAFCDPGHELGFGYVPHRMPGPSGGERALALVQAVRDCGA